MRNKIVLQKMSDGTVRRKPMEDADPREKKLKALLMLEKKLKESVVRTTDPLVSKYQGPLKKVLKQITEERHKILGI